MFLCHGQLNLVAREPLLPFSPQNPFDDELDNVGMEIGFWGNSSSMVTLTIFPQCKPKWSKDEFNGQIGEQRTISWSMMCKIRWVDVHNIYRWGG